MKTKFSILLFCLFFSFNLFAQLPDGSIAPNITFTDIDGNTHNLYDILDEGKSVVFDVMATWCGPCWSYHNTHILRDLYADYGPAGTNEIEIFMIESSTSTNEACLYGTSGCSGGTFGDWTDDTPYPIVHITSGNGGSFNSDFNINFFPTLYKICPNRKIYEIGQPPLSTWENWVTSCNLDATEDISNVICFGEGESGIDLTTEGGYGTINFLWNNGASTEDLTGVPSGSYSCTITEGQGHSIEVGPFIVEGPSTPLIVNVDNVSHVNCAQENNGSIFTSTSGGGTQYTYSWSNGANTPDISNLSGGIYTLSVTDSYGCTEETTVFITEPPILSLNADGINENCDQMDGAILLFANGGQGTYLYDIGNGPTTSNIISDLEAGDYIATVTDENGCTKESFVSLQNEPGPNAEAGTTESISCTDASITLDGTGSETGQDINYSWETSDGNIISNANTLFPQVDQPGTYTLTVLNTQTGCQSSDEVLVEGDLNAPQSDAGEDGLLTCINTTATLDGNGSSQGPQFEYQWLNSNGDEIGTELTVDVEIDGVYELIVLNIDNGCSTTSSVQVAQDIEAPLANAENDDEITCNTSAVNLDGSSSSQGPQFEYQWLNSNEEEISTEINIDVDLPGEYELIVTNTENGCTASSSTMVNQDTENPIADAGIDDQLTCSTNIVNLDGSNSSEGNQFEYQWLNSNNVEVGDEIEIEVDQADTYTLIVMNTENGCTSNANVEITEDIESPTADAGNNDQITCTNTTISLDGSASSTGSEFEYLWLNSNEDEVGTEIEIETDEADTYTLIVSNNDNGCTSEATVEITQNIEEPIADAGNDDELTCEFTSVNLNGGASSEGSQFEYQWLNSNGDEISTDIETDVDQTGTYTLIVSNTENGCTSDANVVITENTEAPIADAGDDDELNCMTTNLNLNGSGSSEGSQFEYQWLNSNNVEIGTEIEVGVDQADIYTFIVTNMENGCTSNSSVEITQDVESPIADAGENDQLTCITNLVNLDGSASSEGNQFEYQWLNSSNEEISTTTEVGVNDPDIYTFVVTNIENGCSSSASVEITENTQEPTADAGAPEILTCNTTSVNLDGSASSSGAEFEYQWLNDNNEQISTEIETDINQAGTYQLIVTNTENGCSSNASITIEQDTQAPVSNAGPDAQLDCTTSVVELNGIGSSTGSIYEYLWLNSNNINVGNSISVEVAAAEVYTLVVTNTENGCTASSQTEVSASTDFPTVEVNADGVLNCNTDIIFIDGDGSSQGNNFTYQWLNNAGQLIGEDISIQVNTPGSYTFLVTDSENGCSASSNIIIDQDINTPDIEIASPDVLDCVNTTTVLDASNSTANGNLIFEWSDLNGTIIGINETVDVGVVGIYNLIITNENNGCTSSSSVEVFASTDIPTASAEVDGLIDCINGAVVISGQNSSANSPLSFSWLDQSGVEIGTNQDVEVLNAGTYTLIVTDTENGCSASATALVEASTDTPTAIAETSGLLTCINNTVNISGSNSSSEGTLNYIWQNENQIEIGMSQNIEVSNAGTYTLIVTDTENGCSASTSILVESNTDSPIAISETNGMLTCINNSVNISGSNSSGNGTLNYSWQNENQIEIGMSQNIEISNAGTYTLIVTNTENGCSDQTTIEVTEDIETPIALAESTQSLNCNLNELTLDGSGSSTGNNINYLWTTTDGNIVGDNDIQNPVIDAAGVYTLIVTNSANGCSTSTTVEVEQISSPVLEIVSISDISCFEGIDGTVILNTNGGTAPYTYMWSNGAIGPEQSNLSAGSYIVSATDAFGCEDLIEVSIFQPEDIVIQIDDLNDNICTNDTQGSISISATGGNGAYTYQWSNGMATPTINGLENGLYTVSITDQMGCQKTEVFEIISTDNVAPVAIAQDLVIFLDTNGNAVINASMINNGSTDNCAIEQTTITQESFDCSNLGQNEIILEVTDLAGNTSTQTAIITVIDNIAPVIICIENIVTNSCESFIEYALPTVIDNCSTTAPVLLEGLPSGSQFPEGETIMTYEVFDISGNSATCSFSITVENTLESSFDLNHVTCFEESDGNITAFPSGGTPNYTYQWNTGAITQSISNISAGEYSVVITDDAGCQFEETFIIEQPTPIEITTDNITNEMENSSDGSVEVSISGGTPSYDYVWTNADGIIISTEEDLMNAPAGVYTLTVTDINNCILISESYTIDNIVSTTYLDFEKYISINPNPSTGQFSVNIELDESMQIQLSVLDINGRVLIDWNKENISTKNYQISLADFPNGIYLARVIIEGEVYVKRVILTKS